LNSIAKGYALDRAAMILERCGVTRFILHGGQSSVVARTGEVFRDANTASMGKSTELNAAEISAAVNARESTDSWVVALTHPLVPAERVGEVKLHNEALGTSGSARQGFYVQGRRLGHILDPRTGWPVENRLSVTVIHPFAAWCDALSTAFFVMKLEEIQTFCAAHPETKALVFEHSTKSSRPWEAHSFNVNDQVHWL
jgi:thiamine biosynthesis lipoprotein